MKKIFWIASYPRSGNTWMRSIISSLFFTKDGIFNFDLLKNIQNFDNPSKFEFVKKQSPDAFQKLNKLDVISKYWIEAQGRANVGGKFAFFKTHSANIVYNQNQYTNEKNTLGFIYIIRDPRDIVISYSHFIKKSIDQTIDYMRNKKSIIWSSLPKKNPYPIIMSSWDMHFQTWQLLSVPKLVIRYESLLNDTENEIEKIILFFKKNYKLDVSNKELKINNIVNSTTFDRLKEFENKYGFEENEKNNIFFRNGKIQQWKKILTDNQVKKINNSFKTTMQKLDYI